MLESITVITLLLSALDRVLLQAIFDRDDYEPRRSALPGARLVKVLVVYQMIHTAKLRGLIRTITEHTGLQAALGGTVVLNTLSNGVAQRDVGQMVEAWMGVLQTYGLGLERMGRVPQAERGIPVDHTTLYRWVQRYAPEFEKRICWYQDYTSASWRVDETYVKVKGKWKYLYQAIDKHGRLIDFFLYGSAQCQSRQTVSR